MQTVQQRIAQSAAVSHLKAFLHIQVGPPRAFVALQKFQDKLSGSGEFSAQPFTARKRTARLYSLTFYCLSGFLLLLSSLVFLGAPNWFYAMYVGHSWLIKALVGSFGVSLAGASAVVAFHLRPEKEAAVLLASRARRRLRQIYRLKATALPKLPAAHPNGKDERMNHLKAAYEDAKAQIFDITDENNLLLGQISRTPHLDPPDKEKLFNQALNELGRRLQELVITFRDNHK